jgi:hypothetical protein
MTNLSDRPDVSGELQSLLAGRFAGWAEAWRIALSLGSPAEPEQSSRSVGDAALSAPAEACRISFTAWLRYSDAVAEAFVRYEANLIQAALNPAQEGHGTSTAENRALVDETRAFLRRVGDAATLEARRAQYELEKVGESIARAAAAGDGASIDPNEHVRRHEAKA